MHGCVDDGVCDAVHDVVCVVMWYAACDSVGVWCLVCCLWWYELCGGCWLGGMIDFMLFGRQIDGHLYL